MWVKLELPRVPHTNYPSRQTFGTLPHLNHLNHLWPSPKPFTPTKWIPSTEGCVDMWDISEAIRIAVLYSTSTVYCSFHSCLTPGGLDKLDGPMKRNKSIIIVMSSSITGGILAKSWHFLGVRKSIWKTQVVLDFSNPQLLVAATILLRWCERHVVSTLQVQHRRSLHLPGHPTVWRPLKLSTGTSSFGTVRDVRSKLTNGGKLGKCSELGCTNFHHVSPKRLGKMPCPLWGHFEVWSRI